MFKNRIFLNIHSWMGFISSVFILSLVITGLILNNPDFFRQSASSDKPFAQYAHKTYAFDDLYFVATRFSLFVSTDLVSFKELLVPFSPKYIVDIIYFDNSYWIALSNAVLFKLYPNSHMIERVLIPDFYELHSLSANTNTLFITSNAGLFKYENSDWVLLNRNDSPQDFWEVVRALHAGYLPFSWFRGINSIVSIFLIILVITGIILFFKKIRFLIDKNSRIKDNET